MPQENAPSVISRGYAVNTEGLYHTDALLEIQSLN
jgi:hypothetical protein